MARCEKCNYDLPQDKFNLDNSICDDCFKKTDGNAMSNNIREKIEQAVKDAGLEVEEYLEREKRKDEKMKPLLEEVKKLKQEILKMRDDIEFDLIQYPIIRCGYDPDSPAMLTIKVYSNEEGFFADEQWIYHPSMDVKERNPEFEMADEVMDYLIKTLGEYINFMKRCGK